MFWLSEYIANECCLCSKRFGLCIKSEYCIVEKTNFMVLYNGSSNGSGKAALYVNGGNHYTVACGHLIANNWFGTLGEYDSSISAGQDTTGSGGMVTIVAGTTLGNSTRII